MHSTNPVSEQLSEQVAAYLAAGNSIDVLPGFEYKPLPRRRQVDEQVNIESLKGRDKQRALRMALVKQLRQLAPNHTLTEAAEIIGKPRRGLADLACEFGIRFQRPRKHPSENSPKVSVKEQQEQLRQQILPRVKELAKDNGITEVSRQLDVSRSVLARMAKQHGIKFRSDAHKGNQTRVDARRVERLRLLAGKGMNISAMAEALKTSRATVLRDLERHQIPRGPRMELQQ
jgi:transcriptional regulator of acetoin/glycerol metabolism